MSLFEFVRIEHRADADEAVSVHVGNTDSITSALH